MQRRTVLTGIAALSVTSSVTALVALDKGYKANGGALLLPEGQPLRELPRLENQSTEAGVFRANLAAEPALVRFADGVDTPMLLYNGGNPVIEAQEGERIEIGFTNGIPDQPTTVHWHGMAAPADQDGIPMDPVAPGGERLYAFDLPEGSAAPYWFHPHPHGHTAEQVYRGLAGVFLETRERPDPCRVWRHDPDVDRPPERPTGPRRTS